MFSNDLKQFTWLFDQLFIWHNFPHVFVEFLLCQKFQYFDNLQLVFLSKGLLVKIVDQIIYRLKSLDTSFFRSYHLHALVHNVYFQLNWVFQSRSLVLSCQVNERKSWIQNSFYLLVVHLLSLKPLLCVFKVLLNLVDVRWASPKDKIFVEKRLKQRNHHS